MPTHTSNIRPKPDKVLVDIAEYVHSKAIRSTEAYDTARLALMDALGCGFEALSYPACTKLLGPVVPGTVVPNGAKVPGTSFQLDPITAAFNISCMVRWLDFNDAATGGHPSDNLGGILATADYLSREHLAMGKKPLVMRDVLTAMIKAYEIQGVIGIENKNNFAHHGFENEGLVKVASTAVITAMLGGTREETINAVSNAWVDGQAVRVYRQAPNTGSRKSWAGADATSRAVRFGLMALKGEMGYPSVLTAKRWGVYDVLFKGKPFKFSRPYGSYVMENVFFKISYPTAFGCQTAVECAIRLHPKVRDRLDDIKKIVIASHENNLRITSKVGLLYNPADRDHCLQYTTAIGLIKGDLTADDFEDDIAADPRIDALRAKMVCIENKKSTRDFRDLNNRANPNAVQVFFKDGSKTDNIQIEYPLGHRRRRNEGLPALEAKFKSSLARRFPEKQQAAILELCSSQKRLEATPVHEFVDLFVI